MAPECLRRKDSACVAVAMDECIQLWGKCVNDFYAFLGFVIFRVSRVGEEVIDPYDKGGKQQAHECQLAGDDEWLVHTIFWLVVVPLMAAKVSSLFAQRPNTGATVPCILLFGVLF